MLGFMNCSFVGAALLVVLLLECVGPKGEVLFSS